MSNFNIRNPPSGTLSTKLDKTTARQGWLTRCECECENIWSGTIRIHQFSPWSGVITSNAEEAWPAQIAVPGQLRDSGH